ncbi:MAG: outer membrane protein assembly factor BamB [Colwellia sp.]
MFTSRYFRSISIVSLVVLVVSCGGGGSGETKVVETPKALLSGAPTLTVNENVEYLFTVSGKNFNGNSISYSIENLPLWANFDASKGQLVGTPNYEQSGIYSNINISATDGTNTAKLSTFSIEVININRLPSLAEQPELERLESELISIPLVMSDPDSDNLTVTLENHPVWLSFDEETSSLVGKASLDDSGFYQLNIIINDGNDEISVPISLTIKDAIEVRGKVIDGYISGAIVYIDENLNVIFDETEISTTTDETGSYVLVLPIEKLSLISKSPVRAYLGAEAQDISRPELDFTTTPLTLSLPPLDITQIENDTLAGAVVSPFSEQLLSLVNDKVMLVESGDLSASDLQFYIQKAKSIITEQVISAGGITLDANQSSDDISEIIFGDFIVSAEDLITIIEQAETYIDVAISSHVSGDFDGDGLANDVDSDDDGDGYDDSVDAFPYDASEWLDTDGDNVGDNADLYPNNATCFAVEDGNGEDCYLNVLAENSSTYISASSDEVVYFYQEDGTLVTFDIKTNHVLNTQQIENVSSMIFHEGHQRLYIGLSNGDIKHLNEDYALTDFTAVEQCVNALVDADSFLIVLDCRGYAGTYVTFDISGEQLGESSNYYDSSKSNAWNTTNNRLYHFRDGISPNDLYYRTISGAGEFIDVAESPYHGDYNMSGNIIISNDGTKVLLSQGDIFSADSLTWLTSIGESFLHAFWLDDGSLVTLHEFGGQEEITLKRRDSNLNLVEVRYFSGNLEEIEAFNNRALLVINDNDSLNFIDYLPSDDNDNDGVVNTLDAFPLDNSASLDTDQDGFPDNWNEGFTGSLTNITIDEFPLDSACWLVSHGNGNDCDFLATQPIFTPDKITSDDAGNIYFLSLVNNRIYRWLSATNQFTNPLVMSSNIYHDFGDGITLAYSSDHNRLYLGYSSGTITRFNLDELKENLFANIGASVGSLASVGNFLLAENANGSWNTHYILDEDGEITDSKDWNTHSETYAWNAADSRVYSLEYNNLHYQTINQTLGHITDDGDIYTDTWASHPIRIYNDGKNAITGNGVVFDLIAKESSLNFEQQFIDIYTMSEQLITIENNDSPKLKIWQLEDFNLLAELDVEGTPLALTPSGEELNLISVLSDGSFNITAVGIVDSDNDGLPLWWESLYNLDDNNASDAALDSDEDGLTNLEEFSLRTNPIVADTDDDGLLDGEEVNTYLTSPLESDSDQDGLTDGAEVNEHGTDPLLSDSDDDGLSDSEEVNVHQSNPLSSDTDDDGLSDLYEVNNQLDINVNDANEDADTDGLVNIDEMTQQTDPNDADSDNDGLNDGDEVHTYLTQPLNRDTDGDKMPDGWEISYVFDPLSNTDKELDFDEDSYANYIEFFLETDPTDSSDIPEAKLWNSYQGNSDHSGFSSIIIDPENLSLRWSVTLASMEYVNSVVSTEGRVFVTDNNNNNEKFVYALNAASGDINWQQTYEDLNFINAPAFNNGKVYFQTREENNSYLRALDAATGENIFASDYGNQWSTYKAPTIFDNDIYVAGGTFGGSYKFDGLTGEELWFQDLQQCDGWTPAVDNNHLYYFSNGFVIADKSSGDVIEQNIDIDISCKTPVLAGNNTALVISNNNLYAFDTQTAVKIWSIETDDYYNGFEGEPSVALGNVYAIKSGELVVLDQFSGDELWNWSPQNNNDIQGNIVLTLNLAFVQDNINTYAIDLSTHEQVWSYPVSGKISLSTEGALYIAGDNGQLTAIDFGQDSDSDGMDDWWEELYGLDSQDASDALLNADSDELTNLEEFQNSTDPTNSDSDHDGLSDSDEVNVHLSNPLSSDSDNDGMDDAWEVSQGFDLLNDEDASLDADNDGITNVEEYIEQTDPNNETSIPDIIETLNLSFEDAIIPTDWEIDETLSSSWGVSSLESTDGDYSIFSSDQSAISFSGFFNGNNLMFDVKSACQYSSNISVYIDDEVSEQFYFTENWQSMQVAIPRGRHTVTFKVASCGVYLDNLIFSPLLSLFDLNVQSVTVQNQQLHLYNFEKELITSVEIPVMDDYYARDLTVLDDGRVAVFNGVSSPSLSIFNPIHGTWQHKTYEDWGTESNGTYGGIAHFNNYVYVTDMSLYGDDTSGIVRFNLTNNSEEFFSGEEYIDITFGQDNMLYALSGYQVDKYDPDTMELINSFTIGEARAIAVDDNSNLYTASWSGIIKQYDEDGVESQQLDISDFYDYQVSGSFYDINIFTQGSLIITNRNQQILLVDSDFSSIELQGQDFRGSFVARVPIIDNDSDGMPMWWEAKYDLNDNDETDALTDLDSDGLSNLEEFELSTFPDTEDTDEDGLTDFEEVSTYLTQPLISDTDSDGLTDGAEILVHLTDPLLVDSDGDLFNDGDEINIYETDPNDINSKPESISQLNITFDSTTLPSDFSHVEDSDADWLIENIAESGEEENYALRSGDIEDSQTSKILWQNVFSAGTLSIDVKVSSETCCDMFYLLVDGIQVVNSVSSEWQTYSTVLSSGQHTIEFRYQKDGSVSNGDDAVWMDNITFESN